MPRRVSRSDGHFPPIGWWKGKTVIDFVQECAAWEMSLRQGLKDLVFTHDLLVSVDGTGGHSGQTTVLFCGEAICVEDFPNGSILAFFWTGRKDPEHAFYSFVPRAFIVADKEGKEIPSSTRRRS